MRQGSFRNLTLEAAGAQEQTFAERIGGAWRPGERIAYRDELMLENIHKGMKNAVAEIEIMVGHNAAELHQLAKLID